MQYAYMKSSHRERDVMVSDFFLIYIYKGIVYYSH